MIKELSDNWLSRLSSSLKKLSNKFYPLKSFLKQLFRRTQTNHYHQQQKRVALASLTTFNVRDWINHHGLKLLILTSLILITYFLYWLISAVLPIFIVEVNYQYKLFLRDKLHVNHISEFFLPDFSQLTFRGRSDYPDYGITIPAIFINEPVVFNVNPNDKKTYTTALKKGIAHASGTSFPDNGGLGYYFAHSSTPEFKHQYNAIFYLLGKLKKEDDIYIWHEGKKFAYRVTSLQITTANDVSFLNNSYPKETIVLQTCWPPGTTQKRLLVFAQKAE